LIFAEELIAGRFVPEVGVAGLVLANGRVSCSSHRRLEIDQHTFRAIRVHDALDGAPFPAPEGPSATVTARASLFEMPPGEVGLHY
jgi:hypothetical protein